VLSIAQAEAELPDEVRRRLRARSRVSQGWVPSAPEGAIDNVIPEHNNRTASHRDELVADEGDEGNRDASNRDASNREAGTSSTAARLGATMMDRVPLGLRGAQVVPSRRAVAGLAGLLATALALALALTWLQRPRESAVPSARRSVPAGVVVSLPPTAGSAPDVSVHVTVHVTGAVRRPGLVELPGGSRVDDAVLAAGGATRRADLASVNLARVLVDGEQIVVLREGDVAAPNVAPGTSIAGSAAPGQPVALNSATLEQLDALPGVGPVLAQRIIDWRTEHGRFSSVDELTEVSGIGERTLAELRPLVRL
jgi:competence protein ComEA